MRKVRPARPVVILISERSQCSRRSGPSRLAASCDTSPFRVISSPGRPAADERGNLKLSNVNPATVAAGLRAAMETYESNLRVIVTLDDLNRRTIDLLKV